MPETKLIGQNYSTSDLIAKVTGRSKYAEDFKADGMLFCKLLSSPRPHARVRRIDASAALAMPGVVAILTAEDMPPVEVPEGATRAPIVERALTDEPLYEGEPILAVAAVDETTAADAIERIKVDLEPLPFVVDPLESLRPNGPNARLDGNVYDENREVATLKWTIEDFREMEAGRLPMGKAAEEWSHGDLDAEFAQAAFVVDETILQQSTSHQPLETRTAMAYWRNGKVYIHASTQSTMRTIQSTARWIGVDPSQVVIISEYTGGGFGSKIPGAIYNAIPALLSRKTGRPVMMRITRREENFIGRARAGFQARVRMGFLEDGRVAAIDLYIVQDNGPYNRQGDFTTGALIASLQYQPLAIRFRGVSVLTNTPPRVSQRAPGGMQIVAMLEPLMDKAARKLGVDRLAIRRLNAPAGKAPMGAANPQTGQRRYATSAFVREAIDRGAELFGWEERAKRSGQRRGPKVTGIGAATSTFVGGSIGYDGLMIVKPDGKLYAYSGIGNHGTHSLFDVVRVAAEALQLPWERVEVIFGDSSKGMAWTCSSAGSQTVHAMSRAYLAAAVDLKRKLQEIAAMDLGGQAEDYDVADGRVFSRQGPGRGLSFARAAERALAIGGKFDGHELPTDIHDVTTATAKALAGQGLMAVAKDAYPRDGSSFSYVVGFAEVEVDVETGEYKVIDYTAVADCGTILNPRSLGAQILGGGVQGMGAAHSQKWVYDKQWGLSLANRFYSNNPPTILDVPLQMKWDAVNIPDPETPTGIRGIGEPPIGAGAAALLCAIADAVGDDVIRRSPLTPDLLLTFLESGRAPEALTAHI